MSITSVNYAFLAVLSVIAFYLLGKKVRVAFLVILSFLFIASFSYNLLIYVVGFTLMNYLLGIGIFRSKHNKFVFWVGVFLNIAQLFILKYSTFLIDPVLALLNLKVDISIVSKIILPVGVSYFTLQAIGYLINIKMGWEKPERNVFKYALYLTFFPKFISGPIERSNHFLPQLRDPLLFNQQNVTEGFRLILFGLIKKLVIANQLGLIINPVYMNPGKSDGEALLLVLLLQPLYLYFDFSGYTDIALGTARAYGIRLLPNFERPFFAENVTMFWKRFHMSLASWFNDYIFKQLSFKLRRYKNLATLTALFLTWTLFGIWHGAGWNFMILGILQAVAISLEFFTKKKRSIIFAFVPENVSKWIGRVMTYLFYSVSLVFFFSSNLQSTFTFFNQLKTAKVNLPVYSEYLSRAVIMKDYIKIVSFSVSVLVMIAFLVIEMISSERKESYNRYEKVWTSNMRNYRLCRYALYYIGLGLIFFYGGVQTSFIYFQF